MRLTSCVSMPNSEPTIKCSNPHCQASNSLKSRFCKRCKTPTIKRYLWAIGEKLGSEEKITAEIDSLPNEASQAISDRYTAISDRVFLDTEPAQTPQVPEHLPPEIVNYLQLFAHFPYIPQVYGQLDGTEIWLLHYGTVPLDREGKLIYKDLLPTMTSLWGEATSFKQLNWLRQLASLWQPLSEKGMVATLVNPDLIRVNGAFIQPIELEADTNREHHPTLKDLGKLWKQWSKQANKSIQDVLIQLSQRMETGSLDRIEQVIALLDRTLDLCSNSHEYTYEIFTDTDSGPKRSSNQDIAYPHSEIPLKINESQQSLTIVCDGVGGHEGGEIASGETVKYLSDRISAMTWDEQSSFPRRVFKQLVQFINEANDAISERNDSEQRLERQRMGTTLVMSLTRKHEVYLSHVGDSRIYLITNNSCHQITTDDDLASREVRLGYAVYRDALQYPSGGALIQALGMRDSSALHPHVQRLVIDDNCLLLLCSDGLSDFDRVEQYWRDVIAPVLDEKKPKFDLIKAVKTSIAIGNERNGHDNVTAALIHCRVKPKSQVSQTAITWSDVEGGIDDSRIWIDEIEESYLPDTMVQTAALKTKNVTSTSDKKSRKRSLLLSMVLGSAFVLGLAILIYLSAQNRDNSPRNSPQSQVMLDRQ